MGLGLIEQALYVSQEGPDAGAGCPGVGVRTRL
jgi:nitrogenase subunit NifH